MRTATAVRSSLVLSLMGTLFAGYLSGVKFFSTTCAFNEPCPFFLGYPACYYGLLLFGTLLVASLLAALGRMEQVRALRTNLVVSFAGILFSGWFVLQEVRQLMAGGATKYALGLPTCAYGLIFYIAVFGIALTATRGTPSSAPTAPTK